MAGRKKSDQDRARAEFWAPRINRAESHRERVIALLNMARARLPEDDPMWAELSSKLGRYLDEALRGR